MNNLVELECDVKMVLDEEVRIHIAENKTCLGLRGVIGVVVGMHTTKCTRKLLVSF